MSGFLTSTFMDSEGLSKTYRAISSRAFSVRELGEAFADFELPDERYIFFEELNGSNHTYSACGDRIVEGFLASHVATNFIAGKERPIQPMAQAIVSLQLYLAHANVFPIF